MIHLREPALEQSMSRQQAISNQTESSAWTATRVPASDTATATTTPGRKPIGLRAPRNLPSAPSDQKHYDQDNDECCDDRD